MKRRLLLKISGLIFLFLQLHSQSFGLEKETHKYLNQYIAQNSINNFSLDQYLKNQLGIKTGVLTPLKSDEDSKRIWDWVRLGGQYEDEPGYSRSCNHFHDPLKEPWTDAGLSVAGFSPFKSSVIWAQDQGTIGSLFGGDWSWKKARDSFYKGLTGLNKDDMDKNLADTFRALGQVMHLVQDSSVPAHVRNDIHIYFSLPLGIKVGKYHYEVWVDKHRGSLNLNPSQNDIFDPSILGIFYESSAPIPIANIFDTNKYDGSNPNIATGRSIGLAEYTNANFFSEDTIFKNYPHPAYDDTSYPNIDWKHPEIADAEDGKLDNRIYIRKTAGEPVQRLASLSYISFDCIKKGYYQFSPIVLDEKVYEDYASKLIPRAVGYSAGLLQYFFRGKLYVGFLVPSVDQAIYNVGNANDTGRDIDTVAFFIQNNSKLNDVIEPIGEGTISLTVSYIDSRAGETVYQSAGTGSVTNVPDMGSENVLTALFTLAEPIPTQFAKELTYYLTFRGELGQEKDAVIGKVIKAPVLQHVSPDQGIEGTLVTIIGDYLPEIGGPFPTTSRNVNFNHDTRWPYTAEVISRTDTEITAKVPNSAAIVKPGYGGLRVRRVVPETEEMIYSNPVPFFPIAEGEIRNSGKASINATIEAVKPILGDYNQLPGPIIYPVLPGQSVSLQLMTGFTYKATANTSFTQDIWTLTPDPMDFVFDLE
jgi:hypothetical protein